MPRVRVVTAPTRRKWCSRRIIFKSFRPPFPIPLTRVSAGSFLATDVIVSIFGTPSSSSCSQHVLCGHRPPPRSSATCYHSSERLSLPPVHCSQANNTVFHNTRIFKQKRSMLDHLSYRLASATQSTVLPPVPTPTGKFTQQTSTLTTLPNQQNSPQQASQQSTRSTQHHPR